MKLDIRQLSTYIILKIARSKKILWALGEHAFLTILIVILLELILGGFLFYSYVFLAESKESEIVNSSFQFKEDIYREILEQWDERGWKLQESLEKEYTNPF